MNTRNEQSGMWQMPGDSGAFGPVQGRGDAGGSGMSGETGLFELGINGLGADEAATDRSGGKIGMGGERSINQRLNAYLDAAGTRDRVGQREALHELTRIPSGVDELAGMKRILGGFDVRAKCPDLTRIVLAKAQQRGAFVSRPTKRKISVARVMLACLLVIAVGAAAILERANRLVPQNTEPVLIAKNNTGSGGSGGYAISTPNPSMRDTHAMRADVLSPTNQLVAGVGNEQHTSNVISSLGSGLGSGGSTVGNGSRLRVSQALRMGDTSSYEETRGGVPRGSVQARDTSTSASSEVRTSETNAGAKPGGVMMAMKLFPATRHQLPANSSRPINPVAVSVKATDEITRGGYDATTRLTSNYESTLRVLPTDLRQDHALIDEIFSGKDLLATSESSGHDSHERASNHLDLRDLIAIDDSLAITGRAKEPWWALEANSNDDMPSVPGLSANAFGNDHPLAQLPGDGTIRLIWWQRPLQNPVAKKSSSDKLSPDKSSPDKLSPEKSSYDK